MNNNEFYGAIKSITSYQNTVALININEFKRLIKISGEYKWIPFNIEKLPYIPIKTNGFKESFRGTNEMVNINITPVWTFLTNGKPVITPKIETFELTEHTEKHPKYTISRKINPNHHYLANSTWENIFDKPLAEKENAVEWNKKSPSILLAKTDEPLLQSFLEKYQTELKQFNRLYEESAETTVQLRKLQKRLK